MRLDRDVKKLIDRYGYDITLSRTNVGGTYSTTTGKVGSGSTTTATLRGVFVNYEQEDIDGTSVLADDRKLLVQARGLNVAPKKGDLVAGDVQIVSVRTIKAGATTIAYVCQARG
jgi:hypothetical protein